jgi:hypothetical protein
MDIFKSKLKINAFPERKGRLSLKWFSLNYFWLLIGNFFWLPIHSHAHIYLLHVCILITLHVVWGTKLPRSKTHSTLTLAGFNHGRLFYSASLSLKQTMFPYIEYAEYKLACMRCSLLAAPTAYELTNVPIYRNLDKSLIFYLRLLI